MLGTLANVRRPSIPLAGCGSEAAIAGYSKAMTDATQSPHPPEDAKNTGQTGSEGEAAPDRPTDDPADVATAVQEEEAKEQSGI
jgi:hypothetical protein